MSMLQIAPYLRDCPRPQSTPCQEQQSIYYFMHDNYYSACHFRRTFRDVKPVGIAWLPGWTWHINDQGKPNIRKTFYDRYNSFAAPVIPAPATQLSAHSSTTSKVFGFVFEISAAEDAKLHATYGTSRIRMAQNLNVLTATRGKGIYGRKLSVVTYFDARNTSDALVNVWEDEEEKKKWKKGFTELLFSGCPKEYVQGIFQQLNGVFRNVEPLQCRDLLLKPEVGSARPVVQKGQRQQQVQVLGVSGSGRSQNQVPVARKREVGDGEERVVKRARVSGPYPSPVSSDPVGCRS